MAKQKHYSSFHTALLQRGVLSAEALREAVIQAEKQPLERYLLQSKRVQPGVLVLAVAAYFNMQPIGLSANFPVPIALLELATKEFWARVKAAPLMRVGDRLTVAFGDPFDLVAQEEVARATKLEIIPLVALEKEVLDALEHAQVRKDSENPDLAMESIMHAPEGEIEFTSEAPKEESLDKAIESADEAPVIRMVNMMLIEALRTGASDIHFEAMEKSSRLR